MEDQIRSPLISSTGIFQTKSHDNPLKQTDKSRTSKGRFRHIFLGHKYLIVTSVPSRKLMTRCPDASLINISAIGIGYSSLGVALLRFLKSMHTLILPESFFSTGTILEIHSAYRQDRINPASNKQLISSLIWSFIAKLNHLAGCL